MRSQSAHLAAAAIPQDLEAADRTKLRRGVGESFVAGFRQISVASAALALLAAATAAATMGGRVKP
jgi:hypothetical protein